jgi:sugar phosphate isomerase/epimerase
MVHDRNNRVKRSQCNSCRSLSVPGHSRREFLVKSALACSAVALGQNPVSLSHASQHWSLPVVVFSKIYQTLHLNFEDAAALTADAGLDGVDPPVRPGGEILPEHAVDELPRYAEALRRRGLQLPFLTTGITKVSSPHAEPLLRAAKKLDIKFYRLGFFERQRSVPLSQQLDEIRAQLKDLAALNKDLGLGAVFENHSGEATIGGDLSDLQAIVGGFDPEQIGVAFDIGHALVAHGKDWRARFEALKSHIKVAYIKDVTWAGRWVPFGQGALGDLGYFTLLKKMNYHVPIEVHIEFDWSESGKSQTRQALVKGLLQSAQVLRRWMAEA